MTVDILAFKAWINTHPHPPSPVTDGRRTSIRIHLSELCDDDNDARHEFLDFVFGVRSTKELTDTQLSALWMWLGPQVDEETGEWHIRPQCAVTVKAVLRSRQVEMRQEELEL
jgi:hypothetical protein